MFKKIFTLTILACICRIAVPAQYAPVPVTGFTYDVIANGTGDATSSTDISVDKLTDNRALVATDFRAPASSTVPAYALPAGGLLSSQANASIQFQLASYSARNSLRLAAGSDTGTLNFVTPRTASVLYLCVTSASGDGTASAEVQFADGTVQPFTGLVTPDWYNTSAPRVAVGIGRVNRANNDLEGNAGAPSLFLLTLTLDTANYNRPIRAVRFTRTTTAADPVLNVLGISAKSVCPTPAAQPTALTWTATTLSSLSGSFTAASGSPSGYLVVRYPSGAPVTAPATGVSYTAGQSLGAGTVVASLTAGTAFTAAGLSPAATYDFYIYSYNTGADCGGPIYLRPAPLTGSRTTSGCGAVSGVISVGPGGAYTTLTSAFSSLATTGINGPVVLELRSTYSSAAETFPITIRDNACYSQANTITVRPAAGANGLSITSSNAGPAVDFNGARFVTIDGTPGGSNVSSAISVTAAGSQHATNLNIINTNASGVAIKIDTNASNNTIRLCDLQGQNTVDGNVPGSLAGVVYFGNSGSQAATGNDFNLIDRCNIHSAGTGTSAPSIGIYSLGYNNGTGTAAYVAQFNDTNTVSACNIYDYRRAAGNSAGIELNYGNTRWLISGNSFFQTTALSMTGGYSRGIWLIPNRGSSGQTGGSFTIRNNYIGGSAPQCGGTPYNFPSGNAAYFEGMRLELLEGSAAQPATVLKGNVIRNISVTTSTGNDAFSAIQVTGGTGTVLVDSNTIGTRVGNGGASTGGAVTGGVTINGTGGVPNHMILIGGTYNVTVSRNVIANIALPANGTYFSGIFCNTAATLKIDQNTIGSLSEVQSIWASSATGGSGRYINGIQVGSGSPVLTITDNVISGLRCDYTTTSTSTNVIGINIASSTANISAGITGNRVSRLISACANTTAPSSTASTALMGIFVVNTSNTAGNVISGNVIDSLVSTSATGAVQIIGLHYAGSASVNANISGNFIHSFDMTAANAAAIITGIHFTAGLASLYNNMVRLGIRPDGTSLTTALTVNGILCVPTTANNINFNSVYIGGSGVGTNANNSFAFRRTGTSGNYDIRNNIFVNNRGNATTGGKHYAVYFTTASAGATVNHNVYQSTGTGGVFAYTGSADVAVYTPSWLGTDVNSFPMDPQFVNPTGSAVQANLHINPAAASAAEGNGTAIAAVTTDYDNQVRSGLTPVDIGADAGNFTSIPACVRPNAPTALLLSAASINQINGSFTASAGGAEGYMVVRYPNPATPVAPADGTNYTVGTALGTGTVIALGPAVSFTDPGLFANTSYGYYVYGYNRLCAGGIRYSLALSGNQSTQACTGLSGTKTVGPSGADYPTLTAALADVANGISGSVILELRSNYISTGETFPIRINANTCLAPATTLTIRPAAGANGLSISSNAVSTVDFRSVRYVTIDGTPGGSNVSSTISVTAAGSQHATNLNIINTNAAGVAIKIDTNASNNTIRLCDLQGQNTVDGNVPGSLAGVVYFGNSGSQAATGNDFNLIDRCNIHSAGTGTSAPSIGIYSLGYNNGTGTAAYVAQFNDTNTVSACNIYDYRRAAGNSAGIELNYGNTRWLISGNSFFQTTALSMTGGYSRGIWLIPNRGSSGQTGGSFTIRNNYIGGSAPQCGGTPYNFPSGNAAYFEGMRLELLEGSAAQPATVLKGNVIRNISVTTSTGNDAFSAIQVTGGTGTVLVDSNTVGTPSGTGGAATGGITISATGGVPNHMIMTGGTYTLNISRNVISNILLTEAGTYFSGVFTNASNTLIINGNTIGGTSARSIHASSTTSTSADRYINGIQVGSGNPVLTISNNMISGMDCDYTSGAQVIGINIASTTANISAGITGNRVRRLTNASANAGTLTGSALSGIIVNNSSNTAGVIISGNRVDSLVVTSTSVTAAIQVTGLYYSGNNTVNATISNNFVHSFDITTANPNVIMTGISYNAGAATILNNMVRLGIKPDGTGLGTPLTIAGISGAGTATGSIYFNSVYIGGTSVGIQAAGNSYAFRRTTTGTGYAVYDIRNNIFANVRSNTATGGGKHYAISLANNNVLPTVNYNVYQYTGIGGNFASTDGGTTATAVYNNGLPWVTGDVNSRADDPRFINPAGTGVAVDLHISTTVGTPVEGTGILISSVTEDIDGQIRSNLTPTDIGADAGNFIIPTVSISGITTVCAGATLTLTASSSLPGPVYTWSGPNSFSFTGSSMSITPVTAAAAGVYTVSVTSGSNTYTATVNVMITPIPVISSVSNNGPLCVGGQLNLTSVVTGSGTVAYQWSGPAGFTSAQQNPSRANVLATHAGSYTLTATANGCPAISSTTVVINANPVITAVTGNSPVCAGSTLNLSVTATATGTVSYQWSGPNSFTSGVQSPSRTNIAAADGGTYSVTVTANNCSATGNIPISVTPLPAITSVSNNGPVCEGAQLDLFGLSLTAGATYSWSGPNGFSAGTQNPFRSNVAPADAGAYILSVTANNCTANATTMVVINPLPVINSVGSNSPVCAGGPLHLTADVATPNVRFLWSGPNGFGSTLQHPVRSNVNKSHAGIYSVRVTAGSCSITGNTTVVVNPLPQPDVLYNNGILTTGSFTSYQWYRNGTLITGANAVDYVPAENGVYTVSVTDANGCSNMSPGYNINQVSVNNIAGKFSGLRVYPNPAKAWVYVDAPEPVTLRVCALDGKALITHTNTKQVDISSLPDGVYLLRIYNGEHQPVGMHKILKQE